MAHKLLISFFNRVEIEYLSRKILMVNVRLLPVYILTNGSHPCDTEHDRKKNCSTQWIVEKPVECMVKERKRERKTSRIEQLLALFFFLLLNTIIGIFMLSEAKSILKPSQMGCLYRR